MTPSQTPHKQQPRKGILVLSENEALDVFIVSGIIYTERFEADGKHRFALLETLNRAAFTLHWSS